MPTNYKTGYSVIVARPNMGKSTLLNRIIGQKIAIATNTAQTTRKNIKGIYTNKTLQIIFTDTPGVHKPINKLGEFLSLQTQKALTDADLVLFLVDATQKAGKGDKWIFENYLACQKAPILLILNKCDLITNDEKLNENSESYIKLLGKRLADYIEISAKTGKNIDKLIEKIEKFMPVGAPLYNEDDVTDESVREIASEIIREKIILNTKEEVPHSVAVLIEKYEAKENIDKITASIYVSSDSQKGILIGKAGSMLKKIGTEARLEIEKMIEKKVFLELFVKVKKKWQKDKNALKMLGLNE